MCVCVCVTAAGLLASLRHYEVAVPVRVDRHGAVLGPPTSSRHVRTERRTRRSPHGTITSPSDDETFYRLTAFGRDFHFNLTRSRLLTSPSLVVEYWSRDGAVRRPAEVTSRRCHYVGHVASDDATSSSVAFSNCFGLVSFRQAFSATAANN